MENRDAVPDAYDRRCRRHDISTATTGTSAYALGSAETAAGASATVTAGVVTAALAVSKSRRLVGRVVRIECVEPSTAVTRKSILLTALRTERVRVVGISLRESSVLQRKTEAEDKS